MIEEAIYKLLSEDEDIDDIVDGRIFDTHLEQNPVFPAISFTRISTPRQLSHSGPVQSVEARFQIDCWAHTPPEARALADAVRALLHGYRGTVDLPGPTTQLIEMAKVDNQVQFSDPGEREFRQTQDVLVRFRET